MTFAPRFVRSILVPALAVLATLALVAVPAARADDCAGRSVSSVHGGDYGWVELRWSDGGWELRTTPKPGAVGAWTPVPGPDGKAEHAHLLVFAPRSHRHFAVIDTAAEHAVERRVRVYDAAGKLVRTWDLGDFVTPAELGQVTRSISHLQWLDAAPEGRTDPVGPRSRTTATRCRSRWSAAASSTWRWAARRPSAEAGR
ncbi:MAG: hypothetical protein U1F43_12320 [Myxococcota bacterium]